MTLVSLYRHDPDLGVVGKDMLMEDGGDELYELHDLAIARCRLMTARQKQQVGRSAQSRLKVATKYVNIAQRFYAEKGIQADIIKLYGGMELAPIMNLADEIVDIEIGSRHGIIFTVSGGDGSRNDLRPKNNNQSFKTRSTFVNSWI